MKGNLFICLTLLVSSLLRAMTALASDPDNGRVRAIPPYVYVILWFDTEDYILPQSDDAAKHLAEMLTRLGVKATFKVVGEKARVLEKRGRRDVISALLKHEIGYHSNTHSQQPTIAVYLQNAGWEDGIAEFERREGQGVKDIERIFGVSPTCYGQPGNSWAPQAYPALRHLGIKVYLDEANHVGIGDQPFYYCGMLNVFKMRSTLARMELSGEGSLSQANDKFREVYDRLRAQGGGTISIYYHPAEFVHREFWDAVNFARGRNPPPNQWRLPPTKSEAEIAKGYRDFEAYITFIKSMPGVSFVTASELTKYYTDVGATKEFSPSELLTMARSVQREISFQQIGEVSLSGADLFSLLNSAVASYIEGGKVEPPVRLNEMLYGPARSFVPAVNSKRPSQVGWDAFAAAVGDAQSYCRQRGRIPDEIWIGVDNISPQDYLATLASVLEDILSKGTHPELVKIGHAELGAERHVAEDSLGLWNWVIFPEGFHAPEIMRLARLQAWTLKPAVLGHKDWSQQ